MTDPDITLTDFALAILCLGFAIALFHRSRIASEYAVLFLALGSASLLGAVWHGWFSEAETALGRNIWLGTMIAVGAANLVLWLIAGEIFHQGRHALLFRWIAWLQFSGYVLAAVFLTRDFLLPSAASVPPTLVLLLAFGLGIAAGGPTGFWLGVVGILVAILGAVLQFMHVGVPALGLSHNGFYHVVQAAAFTLLFLSVPAAERYLAAASR